MPGPAHQNNIVDLWKTLTFIHMQKSNLILNFFLEIFHFKKILQSDSSILAQNLENRIFAEKAFAENCT